MPDYSKMTDGEFQGILEEIVDEDGRKILDIGNVREQLSGHLEDRVLTIWANRNEDKAFPGGRMFPKHVNLRQTAMCLSDASDGVATYYRPAGAWHVKACWVDGVLKTRDKNEDWVEKAWGLGLGGDTSCFSDLRGVVLTEIDEKEFRQDNKGYVD